MEWARGVEQVIDDLDQLTDELVGVFADPGILIGIPLALLGAVFMSFGAQYQHRGVQKVEAESRASGGAGLSGGQLVRLIRRPSWVAGTAMLGLAIVCQLSALSFAPLILVQPLGAISLVITTLLNARITGHRPTRRSITAIGLCVGGILVFVTVAALYATERPVSDAQLITVLVILAAVMVVLTGLLGVLRGQRWMDIREGVFHVIHVSMPSLSVLIVVGMLIGGAIWSATGRASIDHQPEAG